MANARFRLFELGSDASLVSLLPSAVEGLSQVGVHATTNLGEAMKPLVELLQVRGIIRAYVDPQTVFSQVWQADMTLVFDEIV